MNFQDLYKKIAKIEEGGVGIIAGPSQPTMGETLEGELEECGDMMPMSSPKESSEQDRVSVNVNMSGSGSGGIRDLMAILRNIEDAADEVGADTDMMPQQADDEPMFGDMEEEFNPAETFQANTTPEPAYAGIDAVTATGDDLASKGAEAPKVNGGGNPMQEALVDQLSRRYAELLDEAGEKKTMSRAAKGHEKYGKEGMQALAKAGKEGKDLDKVRDKYNKYD